MKSGDAFDDDAGGDDAHSRVSCHTITTAYPEGELGSPTVGRSRKSSMAEVRRGPDSLHTMAYPCSLTPNSIHPLPLTPNSIHPLLTSARLSVRGFAAHSPGCA
jgi:hypothetical protein